MINPFDYLYYKLYKAWSVFTVGEYPPPPHGIMLLLLSFNVYSLYSWIFKQRPSTAIFMIFLIFMGIVILFCYRAKVENQIIAKFDRESKTSRIIGNIAVTIYAILSIWGFGLALKYY